MQNEEKRQEMIERYLDGRMTGEEAVAFEADMKADGNLLKAVTEERMVREAMQRARARDLRQKTAKWRQNLPDPPPPSPPVPPLPKHSGTGLYFWVIALVFCLSLLALYRWCNRVPVSGQGSAGGGKQVETDRDTTGKNEREQHGEQNTTAENPAESKGRPQAGAESPKKKYSARRIAAVRDVALSPAGYVRIQPSVLKNAATPDTTRQIVAKAKVAEALQNKDFPAALQWLQQADSTDINVRQMKAHTLFGVQRYDEAAEVFRTLAGNRLYGSDARKNIVICYLARFPEQQEAYRREIELLLESGSPALRQWAVSLKAELAKLPE